MPHPTVQYILACQNTDYGFGLYPGDGSNLLGTMSAVLSLGLLNEKVKEPERIRDFVMSKQTPEGGFRDRWGKWPDAPALRNTFHAVRTLCALGLLPQDRLPILNYIHSRQDKDGGYLWDYWIPPAWPDRTNLRETFYAIQALSDLGAFPRIADRLGAFLLERQVDSKWQDGSFNMLRAEADGDTPRTVGLTVFTGMGLITLRTLGLEPWDPKKSAGYLHGNQQFDGGFSKGGGQYRAYDDRDVCRMDEAYFAVMGLKTLGEPVLDKPGLVRWIGSCQKPDSGFGRRPDECPSDLDATYQALAILSELKTTIPGPSGSAFPERNQEEHRLKYKCRQITADNFEEIRFLRRIAGPIRDRFSGQGEFGVARQLMKWVFDNLLFCSNYNHSGANTIIDGYATCSPRGRAFTALCCSVDIPARVIHAQGHGLAEAFAGGRWILFDPMFDDFAHDEEDKPRSAIEVHDHFIKTGGLEGNWTHFGDFRYEEFSIEKPDSEDPWKIGKAMTIEDAISLGAYIKMEEKA